MATINKDFKIKSGLIVEGASATVNGNQVLTENASDTYILDLIGGETLVKSVSGNLAVDGAGDLSINETGLATNLSGSYLYDNSGSINVDIEGLYDDLTANGVATTTNVSDALTTAQGYATTAQGNAEDYADGLISTEVTNRNSAISDAISTEVTDRNNAIATAKSEAISSAEGYTDTAVAALVDAAPEMLNTLNELAASLGDNADFIGTVNSAIGEKVAKSGDTMTGELVLFGNPTQGNAAATKSYVDSAASGAYNDAVATADQNAQASANTAYNNAISAIDALTTNDIEETSNLYFTNQRALDAAAQLLTQADTTNITINGTGNGLTIVAENGVADSTTSDLAEGSNLYFTDQRALDAVANSTIYPNIVEINDYRKEEATQQTVQNAGIANVHSFSYPYESAKYLVRVVGWVGGVKHSQLSEVLMTVDGNNNIAITEYGITHTSTSPLATFSADDSNNQFTLTATTAVSGCEIIAAATLLSWAD